MTETRDDRLAARRLAFVEAARAAFSEHGFDDTSLADVVARAGGSLATLYKLFGNKAGLLAAVIHERLHSGEQLIAEIGARHDDPRAALRELGEALRSRFADDESVAISRVVIAYSIKDAEFGARFSRETILRPQLALAKLFGEWKARGIPMLETPDALASIYLGLLIQETHSDAISHGALAELEFRDLDVKIDFFCRGAGLPC